MRSSDTLVPRFSSGLKCRMASVSFKKQQGPIIKSVFNPRFVKYEFWWYASSAI
jgi:hypothetical protein